MKEPTFTPPVTGANSETQNTTTNPGDDGPSLEWIAALKAQATQEMMDDVVGYIAKRATWLQHQQERPAKDVINDMVVDALGDTYTGVVAWDPVRCPLALHLKSVIRSRFSHELERIEDFEHVELDDAPEHVVHEAMATAGKSALAPTKKLSVYVKQFVDRLRELAEDDLPVLKLIDLSLQDITERRHICHMTGMTPSAYHNAFRRLQRLADKIPMNLRTAALDSLR
jgi:hypothetical protein